MRKAILAICCVAALGIAMIGDAGAFEHQSEDETTQITQHHWGRGYHRGWGGGRRGGGYGGGCWGGGY